jgi:hypothetical protein
MTIEDVLSDAHHDLLSYIDAGIFDPDILPELSEVMLAMKKLQIKLDCAGLDSDHPARRLADDAAAHLKKSLREYREYHAKGETELNPG